MFIRLVADDADFAGRAGRQFRGGRALLRGLHSGTALSMSDQPLQRADHAR